MGGQFPRNLNGSGLPVDDHRKWEESVVAYDNGSLSRRGPVKMAGYWPCFALFCSSVFIELNFVLVHEKRTWPISSHLDLTL